MRLRTAVLTAFSLTLFSTLTVSVLTVTDAYAERNNQCMRQINRDRNSCVNTCQSEFKIAKEQCGVNVTCRNQCKAAREECEAPILQQRDLCLDSCEPALEQAKAQCETQCTCSGDGCHHNACFLECRRPALVAAFACRQNCRDAFRLDAAAQAALAQCRSQAKQCVRNCRSSSSSSSGATSSVSSSTEQSSGAASSESENHGGGRH